MALVVRLIEGQLEYLALIASNAYGALRERYPSEEDAGYVQEAADFVRNVAAAEQYLACAPPVGFDAVSAFEARDSMRAVGLEAMEEVFGTADLFYVEGFITLVLQTFLSGGSAEPVYLENLHMVQEFFRRLHEETNVLLDRRYLH